MRVHILLAIVIMCSVRDDRTVGEEPPRTKVPMNEPVPKLSEKDQTEWDKAKAILAQPSAIELFSLEPIRDDKANEKFHSWKVLGKTILKDDNTKQKVLEFVGTIGPGLGARCFEPRHGIRVTAGEKSVDIIVCFECGWAYLYMGKDSDRLRLTVGGDHQSALDKILTNAKVPLPKQARD